MRSSCGVVSVCGVDMLPRDEKEAKEKEEKKRSIVVGDSLHSFARLRIVTRKDPCHLQFLCRISNEVRLKKGYNRINGKGEGEGTYG